MPQLLYVVLHRTRHDDAQHRRVPLLSFFGFDTSMQAPGILRSAYFREVAKILDAAAGGPPDLPALAAVMRRHGLTPTP
jgi:hypothetical protein